VSGGRGSGQRARGVDGRAAEPDLEVEVRAGRIAGCSDAAEAVAGVHGLAGRTSIAERCA